jgi:hypothetical protein
LVYPYLATIDAFDILFGDDLLGSSHFINPSSLEKNKPITKFRGNVHIMRGHDNGQTSLSIESEDEIEKVNLVMNV